jgi:LmbE family N-acetylglucosaminyl deacetylase
MKLHADADLGTVLSIWAHPDDETYLAGGLMAEAVDRGDRVVCVSLTAGELGTSDPEEWPPLRLGRRRHWEAAAAMAVLGVREHQILGFPDGALAEHQDQGLAVVGQLLDDVAPDTILTFGPDGVTFHPDHIAVSCVVSEAWRRRDCRGRLLYAAPTVEHLSRFRDLYEEWGVYMTDERPVGVPDDELAVRLRLDGWQLDRKLTALASMTSQTADAMARLDAELYTAQVSEEAFVDAARHRPDGAFNSYVGAATG